MGQFTTEVLATETKVSFDHAVQTVAKILRRDEVVALPTETVYGLAGNAFQPEAIRKIYAAKERPQTNPLIVHVAGWAMVERCVREWTESAAQLTRAFWPGPLTVVLQRSDLIPDEITAGGDTVAIRWPSHPVMQAVIEECGFPLAAPSANRSNELSPTQAQHVLSQLSGAIPLVVDGGHCVVGIESTVVDLVGRPARVLRPGMIHTNALSVATPGIEWAGSDDGSGRRSILRSPGMTARHYSPKARLVVERWEDRMGFDDAVRRLGKPRSAISVIAYNVIPEVYGFCWVSLVPHNSEAYARALFSELHLCDASGCEVILVEAPPCEVEWVGIWDRLRRAAVEG
ncbi:MAG: Threonylcarbamoyl-AMP synthase [Verrucomicrobia subdivision 3 bacterium]|nr:Threonylcarbamoyl-AMP synthase [Limisphaerales bacterium]MCS1412873.1 Threonylcarbamoyl-AMP synthase [Limisphaerales bacterium]